VSEEQLGTLAGKLIAGTLAVLDQARVTEREREIKTETEGEREREGVREGQRERDRERAIVRERHRE